MATSGSFNTAAYSFNSGTRYLTFKWEVASQSIASNQTVISWQLVGAGTYQYNPVCGGFKVKINDEVVYEQPTSYRINVSIGTIVASGSKTFTHDSNGNCSFTAYAEAGIYTVAVNCTGSSSFSLPKIPRKSTITVSNGTLGTDQTITINRESTSLTHTITYTCGSASGTIATKTSNASVSWTPANTLAEQAPSASTVAVTLKVVTFSGTTEIGSATTSITCTIPNTNTFIPVLSYSTSDEMGYSSKYGGYVQGKSKLKVAINTYGAYGAWITSVKTEFDGAVYSGESVTTNAINASGSVTLKVTSTDSRGRTTVATSTINVLAYEQPKITALTAYRCNSSGQATNTGDYLALKFSSVITSLNSKNKASITAKYKATNATSYTSLNMSSYNGTYTVTDGVVTFLASKSSSYEILLTVEDDFKAITQSSLGSSEKKVWSALKKNNEIVGFAFGKVAEHENTFDIGWPVKFSNGGDCVVDVGESDGWTYRKWDSGVAECWKIHEFSTTINTAFGSLYCGNATQRQTYPFAFIEKPVENVTLQSGSTQAFLYVETGGHGVNGTNSSARYNVFRPGAMADSQTFYLSFHVIGKWK